MRLKQLTFLFNMYSLPTIFINWSVNLIAYFSVVSGHLCSVKKLLKQQILGLEQKLLYDITDSCYFNQYVQFVYFAVE